MQQIKRTEVLSLSQIRHLLRVTEATRRRYLAVGAGMRHENHRDSPGDGCRLLFFEQRATARNLTPSHDHEGMQAALYFSVVAQTHRCIGSLYKALHRDPKLTAGGLKQRRARLCRRSQSGISGSTNFAN